MNLEYLDTYLTVVKTGNFTETAGKLHLSQPAISAQIKRLEKELGIRLIERGRSGISMTQAGRVLYNFAEYVNHQYYYMQRDMERLRKKTIDELNIITSQVCAEYIVPVIINGFKETHALTGVNLIITDSLKVAEEVDRGVYDIGFCSTKAECQGVRYFKLLEDDLVLSVYPGHPLSERPEISLYELSGEAIILREPEGSKVGDTNLLIKSGLDLNQFKLKYIMGTMYGVVSALESRMGIAFFALHRSQEKRSPGANKNRQSKRPKTKKDILLRMPERRHQIAPGKGVCRLYRDPGGFQSVQVYLDLIVRDLPYPYYRHIRTLSPPQSPRRHERIWGRVSGKGLFPLLRLRLREC
jgi:DNA-binding transcriptional LysR family regulator